MNKLMIELSNNIPLPDRAQLMLAVNKKPLVIFTVILLSCIFILNSIAIIYLMYSNVNNISSPSWKMPVSIVLMTSNLFIIIFQIYIVSRMKAYYLKVMAAEKGIKPLKCWECGYPTHGSQSRTCPECGVSFFRQMRKGQEEEKGSGVVFDEDHPD